MVSLAVRWLAGAALVVITLLAFNAVLPEGTSDDNLGNLLLLLFLLSTFIAGLVIRHWIAALVVPLTFWSVVLVAESLDSRSWRPLLPQNWLESLGELNFYLLFLIAVTATLGSFLGWGLKWTLSAIRKR